MSLLTLEEAAAYLKVSRSWLYQHPEVPRHRLPGSTLLRFDQDELLAWLKSHKKEKVTTDTSKPYHRNPRYRSE